MFNKNLNIIALLLLLSFSWQSMSQSSSRKDLYTTFNLGYNVNQNNNYDFYVTGNLLSPRLGELDIEFSRLERFHGSKHDYLYQPADPLHGNSVLFGNLGMRANKPPIFYEEKKFRLSHEKKIKNDYGYHTIKNEFSSKSKNADNTIRFSENRHIGNLRLQELNSERQILENLQELNWSTWLEYVVDQRTMLNISLHLDRTKHQLDYTDFGTVFMPIYDVTYNFNNSQNFDLSATKGLFSMKISRFRDTSTVKDGFGYFDYFMHLRQFPIKWRNSTNFRYYSGSYTNNFNPNLTAIATQENWNNNYDLQFGINSYSAENHFEYFLLGDEQFDLLFNLETILQSKTMQQNATDNIFSNDFSNQFVSNKVYLDLDLTLGEMFSPTIQIGYHNKVRDIALSDSTPSELQVFHAPYWNIDYAVSFFKKKLSFNFNYKYDLYYTKHSDLFSAKGSNLYRPFNDFTNTNHLLPYEIQLSQGQTWNARMNYDSKYFSATGYYSRFFGYLKGYQNVPFNNVSNLQQLFVPNPQLEIPIDELFVLTTKINFSKKNNNHFKTKNRYNITSGAVAPTLLFPFEEMVAMHAFDFMPATMLIGFQNVDRIQSFNHASSFDFSFKYKKIKINLEAGIDGSVTEFPLIFENELNTSFALIGKPFTNLRLNLKDDHFIQLKYAQMYGAFSNELTLDAFNKDIFNIHQFTLSHNWHMRSPLILSTYVNAYHRIGLGENFKQNLIFCNMELSYHRPEDGFKVINPRRNFKRKNLVSLIFAKNRINYLSIGVHDLFNQNNRVFRNIAPGATADFSQSVFTRFIYFKLNANLFDYRYSYDPDAYKKKFRVM